MWYELGCPRCFRLWRADADEPKPWMNKPGFRNHHHSSFAVFQDASESCKHSLHQIYMLMLGLEEFKFMQYGSVSNLIDRASQNADSVSEGEMKWNGVQAMTKLTEI